MDSDLNNRSILPLSPSTTRLDSREAQINDDQLIWPPQGFLYTFQIIYNCRKFAFPFYMKDGPAIEQRSTNKTYWTEHLYCSFFSCILDLRRGDVEPFGDYCNVNLINDSRQEKDFNLTRRLDGAGGLS